MQKKSEHVPVPDLRETEGVIRHLMAVAADLGYEAATLGRDRTEIVKHIGYGEITDEMIDDLLPLLRKQAIFEAVMGAKVDGT